MIALSLQFDSSVESGKQDAADHNVAMPRFVKLALLEEATAPEAKKMNNGTARLQSAHGRHRHVDAAYSEQTMDASEFRSGSHPRHIFPRESLGFKSAVRTLRAQCRRPRDCAGG